VGPDISGRAQPACIRGSVLWVDVLDSIWMQQLHLQKLLLLDLINRRLDNGSISDIRFKLNSELGSTKPAALLKKPARPIDPEKLQAPPEFQGFYDPHVWFNVAFWMEAATAVQDTLTEIDPDHAADYAANAEAYLAELQELDAYVSEQAARVPEEQRVLITAHDAFNYFGSAYGFEVRGLQGISTASEASTADVQELARFIAERQIPAIFVESSVPPRTVEAVQAAVRAQGFDVQIGGELFSDAMGTPGSAAGTYTGMVRHNIDTIVGALLGE
jgi:manganese/zinc/iron transport system substrate-binding protein